MCFYLGNLYKLDITLNTYLYRSSEIGGLCLMKCSSGTLQNLPYFWNTKSHVVFLVFHFMLLFPPNECRPGLCRHNRGKNKLARYERLKKTPWVFVFQKYDKFWSVLLEHLIKHKSLFSEEWYSCSRSNRMKFLKLFTFHTF